MGNDLNVWELPMSKIYYLKHPVKYFKDIKRCFHKAHDRCHNGYCVSDWIDFHDWFSEVIPAMLVDMADKGLSYPITNGENEAEEWKAWLHKIADDIVTANNSNIDKDNEYASEYFETMKSARKRANETDDAFELTLQEKIISNKYHGRMKEIISEKDNLLRKTFIELASRWRDLWD